MTALHFIGVWVRNENRGVLTAVPIEDRHHWLLLISVKARIDYFGFCEPSAAKIANAGRICICVTWAGSNLLIIVSLTEDLSLA